MSKSRAKTGFPTGVKIFMPFLMWGNGLGDNKTRERQLMTKSHLQTIRWTPAAKGFGVEEKTNVPQLSAAYTNMGSEALIKSWKKWEIITCASHSKHASTFKNKVCPRVGICVPCRTFPEHGLQRHDLLPAMGVVIDFPCRCRRHGDHTVHVA